MGSLAEGVRLARDGAFEQALVAFDEAVAATPADPAAWSHRAACLVKLGRLEDAASSLDRGLQAAYSLEAELHRRKGNVLVRLGRHAEAQAALSLATELAPECADAWYDRGVCFLELSLAPDAADAFRRATELEPLHSDAWANLAVALARGGRLDEGVEALGRAAEVDPTDPERWFEYGVALGETGRYDEARRAYERALELDADDPDVWNNLGVALHELGRFGEARAAYERALDLNPADRDIAENRRLLEADVQAAGDHALASEATATGAESDATVRVISTDSFTVNGAAPKPPTPSSVAGEPRSTG